jgi:hypothetical protein
MINGVIAVATPPIEIPSPQPAPQPLQTNTSSIDNVNLAKILVSDAIQSLQNGDSTSAISHLNFAKQQLANENISSIQLVKILVSDAIQSLQNGDSTSAISHLNFAKQQLATNQPGPSGASSGG